MHPSPHIVEPSIVLLYNVVSAVILHSFGRFLKVMDDLIYIYIYIIIYIYVITNEDNH